MNFKPGMNILTSSCYTCCKSRAPPTSGVGGASASITFGNRHFMPHFFGSLLRTGGLLRLLTLNLWSRRPKQLINQVSEASGSWDLEMVTVWKMAKKLHFARNGPFSQILSQIIILLELHRIYSTFHLRVHSIPIWSIHILYAWQWKLDCF